jgi:hypothetical protein
VLDAAERTLAAAVDPAWFTTDTLARLDQVLATGTAEAGSAAGLGRALAAAGRTQPTILTALTDPVHPTEAAWVLEPLTTAPRGSLVSRCGGGEFVPVTRAPVGGNG